MNSPTSKPRNKSITIWLALLFPLLFISDILYGAIEYFELPAPVSPGMVFRGGLLLVTTYKIFEHRNNEPPKLNIWLVLLTVLAIPGFTIGLIQGQNAHFEISSLFKVLYLPYVTALLVILIRQYKIKQVDILRYIEYSSYMLGLSLLISLALGIQQETYGEYAYGSTGIYYAQNDLSLVFGLALLAAGYRLILVEFSWARLLMFFLSTLACTQIGTRASLIVIAAAALVALVCITWGEIAVDECLIKNRLKKWFVGLGVLLVMISLLILGLLKQLEFEYQQDKLEQVPRLKLFIAGSVHIKSRPDFYVLTGEGMDTFQRGVARNFPINEDTLIIKERRFTEIDWLDLFGAYGIGLVVLIYLFILYPLVASGITFLLKRNAIYGLISASSLLYLGHASVAGHAILSPMPSTLMAGYLALFYATASRTQHWKTGELE